MQMTFEISQDELPIFLAEVDDHLQILDDSLIQLEQPDAKAEVLQSAFRAAHTLKGMAGMIGHTRMTRLTHGMETAFDGVRKGSLTVTTPLIDLCLEAIDELRLLRDEVVNGELSNADIENLVAAFQNILACDAPAGEPQPAAPAPKTEVKKSPIAPAVPGENGQRMVRLAAEIDARSVAPAARAFQLMMALQELGEITHLDPGMEHIEAALPVHKIQAHFQSSQPFVTIRRRLEQISELSVTHLEEIRGNGSNGSSAVTLPIEHVPEADIRPKVKVPEPEAAATEPVRQTGGAQRKADMTVRTSVERLDMLMNLVGELITDRNHLFQIRHRLEQERRSEPQVEQLSETVAHLSRITDQLQEEVMRIRMLPIGNVFHKFPRMVRDLAQKSNKKIDVVIHGEDTELDRSMIEEINDPLIHLVRNSVDHGIEPPEERLAAGKSERGTVTLTARHEQGRIILTVSDDGRGIDPDKLRATAVKKGLINKEDAAALSDEQAVDLIFLPGLSTAQKVTDVSGRGVGMDIVHNNIQRVNGTVHVESKVGYGTTLQIVLPLTLAIVPTLLVRVADSTLAIPLVMVNETLRLSQEEIKTIRGKPVTVLRGRVLPLIDMAEAFGMQIGERNRSRLYAVVVHSGKQRVGLVVDSFRGEEEVVVKSLGAFIGDIAGISSSAILGDGKIALIVDVVGLLKLAGIH